MPERSFPIFNEEKAIAVASYLINLQGKVSDKYWFAKVMYYIERESLIKNGQPIFFDQLYSIPFGPIVSSINDSIELCSYPTESKWHQFFSLSNNTITLLKEADYSILSPFERNLIETSYQKFKGWGFAALHDFFKRLPEYRLTKSRITINYDEILGSEGYDPETIEETLQEISYINSLESALHCANP